MWTDKDHLGDGVYAAFDGYMIRLEAAPGNVIYLEPSVLAALVAYGKRVGAKEESRDGE